MAAIQSKQLSFFVNISYTIRHRIQSLFCPLVRQSYYKSRPCLIVGVDPQSEPDPAEQGNYGQNCLYDQR